VTVEDHVKTAPALVKKIPISEEKRGDSRQEPKRAGVELDRGRGKRAVELRETGN